MIRLTLMSRPDCPLCDEMRKEVDALLADRPPEWDVVDVDSDLALARRFGEAVPVLFVNGRLFAKIRLPRFSSKLRLLRAASAPL